MLITEKQKTIVKSQQDITNIIEKLLEQRQDTEKHKEYFYSIGLDSQNKILYIDLVAIGSVNYCIPSIREVLRMALLKNATSLIVSHNHPSGTNKPSNEDITFTNKLKQACANCEIKLLDHIIIGNMAYSFNENGQI